ncbi:MAG: universal stress protein [Myxococcota bacterium]
MVQHILVGIDGSDNSKKAAVKAAEMAQATGAKVTLMFVAEPATVIPLSALDGMPVVRREYTPEELEQILGRLGAIAAELPIKPVEKRVEIGAIADTLCDQAQKLGADLIVVGARGLSPVKRWFLGSVSDRVVHHARTPVLVVR